MKIGSYLIVAGLLLITLLGACNKVQPGTSGQNSQMVVLAEITAGDSAVIPLSVSAPIGNNQTISFQKLTTAAVAITDPSGNSNSLQWNNSPDFSNNPATVYTGPGIFKADQSYSLRVSQPGLGTMSATTHIPQAFSVQNVTTSDGSRNGVDVMNFTFTMADNPLEKNYYIFEAVKQLVVVHHYFFWQGVKYDYDSPDGQLVYQQASSQQNIDILKDTTRTPSYLRLNVFTNDPNTDNKDFGSLDSSFHRIFLTDSLFNGSTYTTTFSIDKTYFESSTPQDKGIVLIQVKSVSKELYDYLSMYERYRVDFGILPPNNLTSPTGNIQNGLGVFGGSYRNEWLFYYDEL